MLKLILTIFAFVAIACAHKGHDHGPPKSTTPSYWAQSTEVKKLTGVDVKWNHTDPDYLHMEVSSKTTGIVAIGFCPVWHGTMEGCDIVIGWVDDATGKPYLYDYHAIANGAPSLDEVQDYELVNATQDEARTTIQFKRRWDTGDTDDDVVLRDTEVQLIYSWHPNDPESHNPNAIPVHDKSNRGHTSVMVDLSKPKVAGDGAQSSATNIWTSIHVLIVVILAGARAAVVNLSSLSPSLKVF